MNEEEAIKIWADAARQTMLALEIHDWEMRCRMFEADEEAVEAGRALIHKKYEIA